MNESVADDVAMLQSAWRCLGSAAGRDRPLAETEFDQESDGENPLWEIARWMPADDWLGRWSPKPAFMPGDAETLMALVQRGLEMGALQRRFAWAIPSPSDLTWMVDLLAGRDVVEIGAGTGYWAWMLEQAGVNVAAYDIHPPSEGNGYCTGGPYADITDGGPEAAAEHPDRALLLSWPPRESDMASRALDAFEGELLFFAGELNPLIVANEAFFKTLATDWTPVDAAPGHVTWWGMKCGLAAWKRSAG
ncbi:hypothetical protein ACFV42_23430 [Streptomyces solisilvae]|uniref:hypothetical protein n=1 Tax=Streptomyces malaysiensis TaxID=92644 RepID=UPI00368AFDEC